VIIRKSYSYFVEGLHIAVDDSLMIMTHCVLMTSAGHPLHNSTVYWSSVSDAGHHISYELMFLILMLQEFKNK